MKFNLKSYGQVLSLFFIFTITSCSTFYQRDFVESKILVSNNQEVIFYDIFKIGVDNYDFIFYSSFKNDTAKMFNYYVNDAVYTALRINIITQDDTVFIEMNMPTEILDGKTKAGTKYQLKEKL